MRIFFFSNFLIFKFGVFFQKISKTSWMYIRKTKFSHFVFEKNDNFILGKKKNQSHQSKEEVEKERGQHKPQLKMLINPYKKAQSLNLHHNNKKNHSLNTKKHVN